MIRRNKLFFLIFIIFTITTVVSCSKSGDSGSGSGSDGASVTWMDFNEGYKKALAEKKPMVIDFYADWCKWCKVMDSETFSDSDVAKKLKGEYVAIRIHTDRNMDERLKFGGHDFSKQEFTAMMGVQGLPTLVFMDGSGKPITAIPGFIKKDVFLPLLSYITEECYAKNVPFESYMKDDKLCKNSKTPATN